MLNEFVFRSFKKVFQVSVNLLTILLIASSVDVEVESLFLLVGKPHTSDCLGQMVFHWTDCPETTNVDHVIRMVNFNL